jgi:hypothetical protein
MDIKRFLISGIRYLLTVLFIIGTSCTAKKQKDKFSYGTDRDLLLIADFDNQEFEVETKEIETNSSLAKDTVKSQFGKNKNEYQNFVKYTTSAKLLEDVPFLGKPNSTYYVRYLIENTTLKVFKIGEQSSFSVEEAPSAVKMNPSQNEKLKNIELWGVPLVSYNISIYNV